MTGVGCIGLGNMGTHQARTFAQAAGCDLVAGADLAAEMRTRFAENFPDVRVHETPEALLADPEVEAVVVAVPTGHHEQLATAALAVGKPVMLEKPMARTVEQCARLIDASEKSGTLLMVAHCRRYDAHWKSWGEQVTSGRLGSPILWRDASAIRGPGGWFMDEVLGGGPLIDGAVHNYDFANWIFGEPESVVASAIKMDPQVTALDTGSAVVRYRGGNQLLVSWSWSARGSRMQDVIGPDGFIQFGTGGLVAPAEDEDRYQYCCVTDREGVQTLIKAAKDPDMYAEQALHFLACVRGEIDCRTPGTEAIKAVAVAEAILQVAADGGTQKVCW